MDFFDSLHVFEAIFADFGFSEFQCTRAHPYTGLKHFVKKEWDFRDFGKLTCRFRHIHTNAKVEVEEGIWVVYENRENPKSAKMG